MKNFIVVLLITVVVGLALVGLQSYNQEVSNKELIEAGRLCFVNGYKYAGVHYDESGKAHIFCVNVPGFYPNVVPVGDINK